MKISEKILWAAAAVGAVWLGMKFVLPVALPFLLGALLAFLSEPLVRGASQRISRGLAAGLGVTVSLAGLFFGVYLLGAVVFRQLKSLSGNFPELARSAGDALLLAEDFCISLCYKAPEAAQPFLQNAVVELFDGGTVLLQQVGQHIPSFLGKTVTRVGDGVLGVGTGVLSAFLISARLPQIKSWFREHLPPTWKQKYQPAWKQMKKSLFGYMKAQLKLMGLTFCVLAVGLTVLQVPYSLLWAAAISLVDGFPILGTGTVLLPWAALSFLQGNTLLGVGLLSVYGVCFLVRTVFEPRLVGRQLGLDPLITLISFYAGYRLWGFWGMLITPILVCLVVNLRLKQG